MFDKLQKSTTPTSERNYQLAKWVCFTIFLLLIAFAYVDVGTISIGSNNYNLSLIRLNKAIAYTIAILGLQVVIGSERGLKTV